MLIAWPAIFFPLGDPRTPGFGDVGRVHAHVSAGFALVQVMNGLQRPSGGDELSTATRRSNGSGLRVLQVGWLELALGHGLLDVGRMAGTKEEGIRAIDFGIGDAANVHGLSSTKDGNGIAPLALVVAHLTRGEA